MDKKPWIRQEFERSTSSEDVYKMATKELLKKDPEAASGLIKELIKRGDINNEEIPSLIESVVTLGKAKVCYEALSSLLEAEYNGDLTELFEKVERSSAYSLKILEEHKERLTAEQLEGLFKAIQSEPEIIKELLINLDIEFLFKYKAIINAWISKESKLNKQVFRKVLKEQGKEEFWDSLNV